MFDPNPEHLRLDECEREFMKLLHPLIPSPRAAKRFVNVYRLLRTSVNANERAAFVRENKDGEYRAVQLLLAIQTGYPEQATEIIRDLFEENSRESWWDFIHKYEEKYGELEEERPAALAARAAAKGVAVQTGGSPAGPVGTAPAVAEAGRRLEAERWRQFLDRLNRLSSHILVAKSCDDFVKWAPRVARYSFQSARVLQLTAPRERDW